MHAGWLAFLFEMLWPHVSTYLMYLLHFALTEQQRLPSPPSTRSSSAWWGETDRCSAVCLCSLIIWSRRDCSVLLSPCCRWEMRWYISRRFFCWWCWGRGVLLGPLYSPHCCMFSWWCSGFLRCQQARPAASWGPGLLQAASRWWRTAEGAMTLRRTPWQRSGRSDWHAGICCDGSAELCICCLRQISTALMIKQRSKS